MFICFIEIISILAKKLMQFKQAVNKTASNFLLLGLKMKFFCSLTPKNLRNHLSWELSWTPRQKVFLNDAWTPSFQRTLLASKRFTIVHCRLRNMDHPSLIMLHWSNLNWYRCIICPPFKVYYCLLFNLQTPTKRSVDQAEQATCCLIFTNFVNVVLG